MMISVFFSPEKGYLGTLLSIIALTIFLVRIDLDEMLCACRLLHQLCCTCKIRTT